MKNIAIIVYLKEIIIFSLKIILEISFSFLGSPPLGLSVTFYCLLGFVMSLVVAISFDRRLMTQTFESPLALFTK